MWNMKKVRLGLLRLWLRIDLIAIVIIMLHVFWGKISFRGHRYHGVGLAHFEGNLI